MSNIEPSPSKICNYFLGKWILAPAFSMPNNHKSEYLTYIQLFQHYYSFFLKIDKKFIRQRLKLEYKKE